MRQFLTLLFALVICSSVTAQSTGNEGPVGNYTIVGRYPHDTQAFTQGLIFEDGYLYESTGRRGLSELRKVDLETGNILQSTKLPATHFGEGMTSIGDELVSITYTARLTHRWNKSNLQKKPRQSKSRTDYRGQGWGLTYDGELLIMSSGNSKLQFRDPKTFKLTKNVFGKKKLKVRYNGRRVKDINELEFVEGKIFANIWRTSKIAIIDPKTGVVEDWLDLSAIVSEVGATDPEAVLNGIAYDKDSGRLFLTGKLWPHVYEIKSPLIPTKVVEQ